jgi:gamma-glutamyl:cysteine ligase YbdK (ATP-grasp superfamily)
MEQKDAPTECPVCQTPINQHLSRWATPASSCGSEECQQELRRVSQNERKARSREKQKEQRKLEEEALDQRIRNFSETLQPQHRTFLLFMQEKYGRDLAANIIEMIEAERREAEAQRCKHDNITTILDAYSRCQHRADAADRHNAELRARVQELEQDVQVYQAFENKVIGRVAQEELRKQPDPALPPSGVEM